MREEIIKMAIKSGLGDMGTQCGFVFFQSGAEGLERFFHMAQAAEREQFAKHAVDIARRAISEEREACANVADQISDKYAYGYYGQEVDTADEIAAAIRARSGEKK